MKNGCLTIVLFFAAMLFSCGDSDLLDNYIAEKPRALAIKIEDPEARPGDQVSMKLLVGGESVDQSMDETVSWYFVHEQVQLIGTAAYDQEFVAQTPGVLLDDGAQWLDLTILASIQIESKTLTAEKSIRITQNPVGKNPSIDRIQINYIEDGQLETDEVFNADQIAVPSQVKNIAFTALTDTLAPGENDRLIFRWHTATSQNSGGKLYINNDSDVASDLLGSGVAAAETKASAVFSLRGEFAEGSVQSGIYDVYLVVRDNATSPESKADDRFGTDFIYFTLCVDSDC